MITTVIAHHSRETWAKDLAASLEATIFMDEGNHGANWNHKRALEFAAGSEAEYLLVVEDDAVLAKDFLAKVRRQLYLWPSHLVSFYLGTGRPEHSQARVAELMRYKPPYVMFNSLLHAVAYALPVSTIPRLLSFWSDLAAADDAVGNAWLRAYSQDVVYPLPCLVDHRDDGSVDVHPDEQDRVEVRKAWWFDEGV